MARAWTSAQCDSIATYMDGVQVKIAEAYKPPKKIVLPPAYFNKLPDVSKYTYDFSLEKNVLEKMTEWRKARVSYSEARKTRLEEKRKKEAEHSPPPSSPNSDSKPLPGKIATSAESTMLTPQWLSSPAHESQNHGKINGLDSSEYSYFDNDTSSPFDNMELETINEMEELAQVLQPSTTQWAPNPSLEGIMNDLTIDQQNVDDRNEEDKITNKNGDSVSNCRNHTVSLIVQELQKQLERPIVENWQPWPDIESPSTNKSSEASIKNFNDQNEVAKAFADLSIEGQKLAKHFSDMGFSLSRAARAIRDLKGQDNKKIVEYLLAIQSLEDLGISEDAAVKALALTQYDQHKAKVYYESLCTLRDLGFPEDKASVALLKCNIDRDSALDLLIT